MHLLKQTENMSNNFQWLDSWIRARAISSTDALQLSRGLEMFRETSKASCNTSTGTFSLERSVIWQLGRIGGGKGYLFFPLYIFQVISLK